MKRQILLTLASLLILPLTGQSQIITTFYGSNPVASSALTVNDFP